VSDRLSAVSFTLKAKVKNLSTNAKEDLWGLAPVHAEPDRQDREGRGPARHAHRRRLRAGPPGAQRRAEARPRRPVPDQAPPVPPAGPGLAEDRRGRPRDAGRTQGHRLRHRHRARGRRPHLDHAPGPTGVSCGHLRQGGRAFERPVHGRRQGPAIEEISLLEMRGGTSPRTGSRPSRSRTASSSWKACRRAITTCSSSRTRRRFTS